MRGTSVPLTAVAFFACAVVVLAQSPTPAAIKQDSLAGRHEQAWTAVQTLPVTPDNLRLAIDISLRARRLDRALTSYERLVGLTHSPELPHLAAISRGVLERARGDADPVAQAESCRTLLRAGDGSCKGPLQRGAANREWPTRARLIAAAAVAEKDRTGEALLAQVVAGVQGHEGSVVAEVAAQLPANQAVPILRELVMSPLPDVQYVAATLLGNFDSPDVRASLAAVANQAGFSPARPAARLSLAKLGDKRYLAALGDALPMLAGVDLYRAGEALAAAGDRRGVAAMEAAMATSDPDVRLEAAAALAKWSSEKVHPVIEEGLRSASVAVRLHALDVVTRLGWSPSGDMWKLLADAHSGVRVKAAAICLKAETPRQPMLAAK